MEVNIVLSQLDGNWGELSIRLCWGEIVATAIRSWSQKTKQWRKYVTLKRLASYLRPSFSTNEAMRMGRDEVRWNWHGLDNRMIHRKDGMRSCWWREYLDVVSIAVFESSKGRLGRKEGLLLGEFLRRQMSQPWLERHNVLNFCIFSAGFSQRTKTGRQKEELGRSLHDMTYRRIVPPKRMRAWWWREYVDVCLDVCLLLKWSAVHYILD